MVIDAQEGRDIVVVDVAGAYLLSEMPDYVLVKVMGESVDIMCQVSPEYKKFVTMEKGKKVLYMRLKKALYGCVQSALLWYEKFTGKLMKMGFELNPYDPCVANLEVNGEKCTICWYVDNTKISHKEAEVVDWVIKELEDEFGEMTKTRGTKHTFVGMDFEIQIDGTVKLLMKEYLKECIEAYGEPISGKANSPAKSGLFYLDEDAIELEIKRAEIFHHIVAKLLFIAKRARPDIEPTIAFLCTRVIKSTTEDWEKLKRLLEYIKETIDMPRIIGATGGMDILRTWVDASYATHSDMKGHTGGAMSMGVGLIYSK